MQWVVYAPNPNPPIKKRGLSLQLLVSNGERGSLVVAGWPSWLTAVAAEAIAGWIPRTADSFHKLDKAGLQHCLHCCFEKS